MFFLPYRKFSIRSKLPSYELKQRIEEITEPLQFVRLTKGSSKPMEGFIIGNRFLIKKKAAYMNAFVPRILGEINEDAGGQSFVKLKLKLRSNTLFFISLWSAMVSFAGVLILMRRHYFQEKKDFYFLIIPLGFLVLGYIVTIIGFQIEAAKMKKYLFTLMDGVKAKRRNSAQV
jgi:hypothetical protein